MSLPLWTPDEIAAATGARIVGRLSAATGVSIDTRTLAAGRPVLRHQGRRP